VSRPAGFPPRTGPGAIRPASGNNRRLHGGTRTRFVGTGHHGDRAGASLALSHPAIVEGRTLFPSTVIDADKAPRVLVSGVNNAKIGRVIEKGPWAGFPIFTLTLEERATCPTTCQLWSECMGNAMHWSRRHRAGPPLIAALDNELRILAKAHPCGFAVRLHILGDFYSVEYAQAWSAWLRDLPALHVWGYTARLPGTDIGDAVDALNDGFAKRWRIRFSVATDATREPMQVTTIWRQPASIRQPEGAVCPQQFDKTATCSTCGLCWAPASEAERIVFVGHGKRVASL
jgi:hypothetical protein